VLVVVLIQTGTKTSAATKQVMVLMGAAAFGAAAAAGSIDRWCHLTVTERQL
jgi:hypothetical protein